MSRISFSFIVHQGVEGARRHGEQVTGVSRVCAVKKQTKRDTKLEYYKRKCLLTVMQAFT